MRSLSQGPAPPPLQARLDVLDAETEGQLGFVLELELGNALRQRQVAALLTQVRVDPALRGQREQLLRRLLGNALRSWPRAGPPGAARPPAARPAPPSNSLPLPPCRWLWTPLTLPSAAPPSTWAHGTAGRWDALAGPAAAHGCCWAATGDGGGSRRCKGKDGNWTAVAGICLGFASAAARQLLLWARAWELSPASCLCLHAPAGDSHPATGTRRKRSV